MFFENDYSFLLLAMCKKVKNIILYQYIYILECRKNYNSIYSNSKDES